MDVKEHSYRLKPFDLILGMAFNVMKRFFKYLLLVRVSEARSQKLVLKYLSSLDFIGIYSYN